MASYDSAALLAAFKRDTNWPRNGEGPLTDDEIYEYLSEAQEEIIGEVAMYAPDAMIGPPVALVTADSGVTYTFGTDTDGDLLYPLAAEVFASANGRQLYASTWSNPGGDFVLEGNTIRTTNGRARTYTSGPIARFVTPPAPISDSTEPSLLPKFARKLIVLRAAEKYAQRGGKLDPRPYQEEYATVWAGKPGMGGGVLLQLKQQFNVGKLTDRQRIAWAQFADGSVGSVSGGFGFDFGVYP